MYLGCCRWEYVKMQSREDSLWESFPQALKTREVAGRYINAFWACFQSRQDVYILQACSLLAIPPPEGSAAPQGGFLTDLTGINLSDWAALVQDVAAGLQALPPDLGSCLGLGVVNLLQLLEAATGVGFATSVAIWTHTVGVWEPLSWLPLHRGARL